MKTYAKINNKKLHTVDVGLETNEQAIAFYQSIGMTQMDVEQGYDGNWYLEGYAPEKPAPTILEQIEALEAQITDRNIRSAIIGDEYALNKIAEIEAQIAELRKQLEEVGS